MDFSSSWILCIPKQPMSQLDGGGSNMDKHVYILVNILWSCFSTIVHYRFASSLVIINSIVKVICRITPDHLSGSVIHVNKYDMAACGYKDTSSQSQTCLIGRILNHCIIKHEEGQWCLKKTMKQFTHTLHSKRNSYFTHPRLNIQVLYGCVLNPCFAWLDTRWVEHLDIDLQSHL